MYTRLATWLAQVTIIINQTTSGYARVHTVWLILSIWSLILHHLLDPNVSGLLSNPDALMKLAKELNTITQATSAQPVDASRSVGAVMTKQASRNVKQQPPSSCDPVMDAVERYLHYDLKFPLLYILSFSFYSALPHQCKTCGFRFLSSSEHSKHLDWHFRINRMQNQKVRSSSSNVVFVTMLKSMTTD